MIKRLFDLFSASFILLLFCPFFVFVALLIVIESKGGVFYRQVRVGRNEEEFLLFKFRTMATGSDKKGLITVGARDSRITKVGYYLRRYKIDEFPQLLNIIKNDMSVVGPRPEVPKYVTLYSLQQKKVLQVKPGLTDLASLAFIDENTILGKAEDPEKVYINEIMPEKLRMNLNYIENQSFIGDLKIIQKTVFKIFS
jgi:lipopolysaccharide/colanic/teichoic acid biosynthesis glycosyltransferase